MSAELVLELPATTGGLRSGLDSIEEACAAGNIPRDTRSRLVIALEELVSNTIKYGYGEESQRPVRVRLRWRPPIELVYEDEAPPFDPIVWLAESQQGAPPADDVVGRKGVALVLGIARSARYERLPGGNRLTLRFA
jgi:anti-sigma regulatory factor (Ser/Thr protein kinase)